MCIYCNLFDQLNKVNDIVKNAGYQDDSLIVKGIAKILATLTELQVTGHLTNITNFTIKLVVSILPIENSYYEIVRYITKNFEKKEELAYALVDWVLLMSTYRRELRVIPLRAIDNNFKKIFTDPEVSYRGEFDSYYITDSDSDIDSESDIEEFNERYQNLAPPKEEQLDRLANELNLKLCEECLMPYKGQACDCWLQEIEEGIFSK